MKNARLTSLTIENFKSFRKATTIPIKPLTVIVGRNNSGKSTLIQSLLLLKQTLDDPRISIPLSLDGPLVEAFSLRELTSGWPEKSVVVPGPILTLEWEGKVNGNIFNIRNKKGDKYLWDSAAPWGENSPEGRLDNQSCSCSISSKLCIDTHEIEGYAVLTGLELTSIATLNQQSQNNKIEVFYKDDFWRCSLNGQIIDNIKVEFNHFIPMILPLDNMLSFETDYNQIRTFFEKPLDALTKILRESFYLSSHRDHPSSLYKAPTSEPREIGIRGEFAPQILYHNRNKFVYFLSPKPCLLGEASITKENKLLSMPLEKAINHVMVSLGIKAPLKVADISDHVFQIHIGKANLPHVGRGLNFLFPLVELGLYADPLRFAKLSQDGHSPLDWIDEPSFPDYEEYCNSYSHIILEEPEAHIHPKVASRLAHYFVSLAMARRQLIVETHNDHLVRRLRRMAVEAGAGSELEKWLLENVAIIEVSQDETSGESKAEVSRLTAEGGLEEHWPQEFMDEASDEESAIFYARLDKTKEAAAEEQINIHFIEDDEPEDEVEP
ncbi:MAG: AAA family ATPase [Magnetococcales bacterium]|nr:AAA family ATPase [Magnetococcales bacterium]